MKVLYAFLGHGLCTFHRAKDMATLAALPDPSESTDSVAAAFPHFSTYACASWESFVTKSMLQTLDVWIQLPVKRQTDRQAERQTGGQTGRQAGKALHEWHPDCPTVVM